MHVLPVAPVSAPVFLHEGDEETARHFVVLGVVVLLQQRDLVLRVDPERVCTRRRKGSASAFGVRLGAERRRRPPAAAGLTGVVPAASGGAALPPAAVELDGVPVVESVLAQSVRAQVADLQAGKLPLEFVERHPVGFKLCMKM